MNKIIIWNINPKDWPTKYIGYTFWRTPATISIAQNKIILISQWKIFIKLIILHTQIILLLMYLWLASDCLLKRPFLVKVFFIVSNKEVDFFNGSISSLYLIYFNQLLKKLGRNIIWAFNGFKSTQKMDGYINNRFRNNDYGFTN